VPAEPPSPPVLERLTVIREMIRGLLDPAAPDWTPEARRLLAESRFAIDPEGQIRSEAAGWDGFVSDLMLPLLQLVPIRDGLGICGNPHCRLVFLDLSRNRTRRWCDTRGCGNRDRVGRFRSAPRAVDDPPAPGMTEGPREAGSPG
jgi:predicted RNA-binding Zn ribbon-like protein